VSRHTQSPIPLLFPPLTVSLSHGITDRTLTAPVFSHLITSPLSHSLPPTRTGDPPFASSLGWRPRVPGKNPHPPSLFSPLGTPPSAHFFPSLSVDSPSPHFRSPHFRPLIWSHSRCHCLKSCTPSLGEIDPISASHLGGVSTTVPLFWLSRA
jgi:hypothetical protein